MSRFEHEALYQCNNEDCSCTWVDNMTGAVDFPELDYTGDKMTAPECPECRTKFIPGVMISTEDLDFEENMRASVIEGRADTENGR